MPSLGERHLQAKYAANQLEHLSHRFLASENACGLITPRNWIDSGELFHANVTMYRQAIAHWHMKRIRAWRCSNGTHNDEVREKGIVAVYTYYKRRPAFGRLVASARIEINKAEFSLPNHRAPQPPHVHESTRHPWEDLHILQRPPQSYGFLCVCIAVGPEPPRLQSYGPQPSGGVYLQRQSLPHHTLIAECAPLESFPT